MKYSVFLLLLTAAIAKAQVSDGSASKKQVTLLFTIIQDERVYDRSAFGEPPQLAIWLQNQETGERHTVFVTEKTGNGSFDGTVGVPVALPAWITSYRLETGTAGFPTPAQPVVDGITGPTTRDTEVERRILVTEGSAWNYYVEVNVSGDYNQVYPQFHEDGTPDGHGNGQPSLIYAGKITARPGERSQPDLLGRTEQLFYTHTISQDLAALVAP